MKSCIPHKLNQYTICINTLNGVISLVSKGLKNIAYDYLYEEIISYRLMPGQAIGEQAVSDLLGISRTPVREALKKLESEELVYQVTSRGTFVKDITAQDVNEIFELRMLLEKTALNSAIIKISNAELDDIEKSLSLLTDASSKEEFYKSDRNLHKVIMKYSDNVRMINIHAKMDSELERLRRVSSMKPDRLAKSRIEHMNLLNAIRARDLNLALFALTDHLNNVKINTLIVCQAMRLDCNSG